MIEPMRKQFETLKASGGLEMAKSTGAFDGLKLPDGFNMDALLDGDFDTFLDE